MCVEHPKALIVVVHYKTDDGVLALLESLQQLREFPKLDAFIVDNSSGEENLPRIRRALEQLQNAELLESATNRGYFGAARFAFDHYLAQGHGLPDWVIVCNHDVLIEDEHFFTGLFSFDPLDIGVIAPRIRALPADVDQNPFMRRRPSRLQWTALRFVSSNYGVAAVWDWLSRRKMRLKTIMKRQGAASGSNGHSRRELIYAPHGSFFVFSRRYFETGGYLDGNLFLYGEEISVAEICRSLRLPVIYETLLCVVHNEHQSTGQALTRFSFECQKQAIRYLMSKFRVHSKELANSSKPHLLT